MLSIIFLFAFAAQILLRAAGHAVLKPSTRPPTSPKRAEELEFISKAQEFAKIRELRKRQEGLSQEQIRAAVMRLQEKLKLSRMAAQEEREQQVRDARSAFYQKIQRSKEFNARKKIEILPNIISMAAANDQNALRDLGLIFFWANRDKNIFEQLRRKMGLGGGFTERILSELRRIVLQEVGEMYALRLLDAFILNKTEDNLKNFIEQFIAEKIAKDTELQEPVSPRTLKRVSLLRKELEKALEEGKKSPVSFVGFLSRFAREGSEVYPEPLELGQIEPRGIFACRRYRQRIPDPQFLKTFLASNLHNRLDVDVYREVSHEQEGPTCVYEALANIIFGNVEYEHIPEGTKARFMTMLDVVFRPHILEKRREGWLARELAQAIETLKLRNVFVLLMLQGREFAYLFEKEDMTSEDVYDVGRMIDFASERKKMVNSILRSVMPGQSISFFFLGKHELGAHASAFIITKPLAVSADGKWKWKIRHLDSATGEKIGGVGMGRLHEYQYEANKKAFDFIDEILPPMDDILRPSGAQRPALVIEEE